MKCKGKIKVKAENGKTRATNCNEQLELHAIFCPKCGEPTKALSTDLSAKQNFNEIWEQFRTIKSKFYTTALLVIIPLLAIIAGIYFRENLAEIVKIDQYYFTNLLLLVFIPFLLTPFASKPNFSKNLTLKFQFYPKMFLVTLMNLLYFFILKIICTGYHLNLFVDPILHLVMVVLVLYWITIMIFVPILVIRKKTNPSKAEIMCYKASAETRWQQFFLVLQITFVNVIGVLFFGFGLLISLPLSYILIENYFAKLEQYQLFN